MRCDYDAESRVGRGFHPRPDASQLALCGGAFGSVFARVIEWAMRAKPDQHLTPEALATAVRQRPSDWASFITPIRRPNPAAWPINEAHHPRHDAEHEPEGQLL